MIEMIEKVVQKLRLLVGRCDVQSTKYKDGQLTADVELIAGEKRRNVEFLQNYGFSSRPKGNVSGVAVFIGGSRENGTVIATNGDDMTPKLEEGEVMVHSPFGQSIYLKKDGNIEISASSTGQVIVNNDIVCKREVYAMAMTEATKVSLSKHIHATNMGSTAVPTVGS